MFFSPRIFVFQWCGIAFLIESIHSNTQTCTFTDTLENSYWWRTSGKPYNKMVVVMCFTTDKVQTVWSLIHIPPLYTYPFYHSGVNVQLYCKIPQHQKCLILFALNHFFNEDTLFEAWDLILLPVQRSWNKYLFGKHNRRPQRGRIWLFGVPEKGLFFCDRWHLNILNLLQTVFLTHNMLSWCAFCKGYFTHCGLQCHSVLFFIVSFNQYFLFFSLLIFPFFLHVFPNCLMSTELLMVMGWWLTTVYQFIMEFLFRVIKKTWLLPPERTEAKKTWRREEERRKC